MSSTTVTPRTPRTPLASAGSVSALPQPGEKSAREATVRFAPNISTSAPPPASSHGDPTAALLRMARPKTTSSEDALVAINMDILRHTKQQFEAADTDNSGSLELQEFLDAFEGKLDTEDGNDREALTKLFMRLDANSDGSVNWDEFSSYMLLEGTTQQVSSYATKNAVMFGAPQVVWHSEAPHEGMMTAICFVSSGGRNLDRYFTCAQDRTIKVWSAETLRYLATIPTGMPYMSSACLLPRSQRMVVGSVGQALKIYDINKYEVCGVIPNVETIPMAMEAWTRDPEKEGEVEAEYLCFGDFTGQLWLFQMELSYDARDVDSHNRFKNSWLVWKVQVTSGREICAIKYVQELNAVVVAAVDKVVTIVDIEQLIDMKRLEGHSAAVRAVDWSKMYKFVYTAGDDCLIKVWNPYSSKPVATIVGHEAPILRLFVNDRDNQIISVSSDKVIKSWDILNQRCEQTIHDTKNYYPENRIGVMHFNKKLRKLVGGATDLQAWPLKVASNVSGLPHNNRITTVLYNPLFEELVSADEGGAICIWRLRDGKLRTRLTMTAPGTDQELRVTALSFDPNWRRLVAGAEDGNLKVWNFSTGTHLRTLLGKTKAEISIVATDISAGMLNVVAGGWDAKLSLYEDHDDVREVECCRLVAGHKADILSCDMNEGRGVMASSDYSGEIIVWTTDQFAIRTRLRPESHNDRPESEHAVECVKFLRGPFRNILVAVGADRFMRLWDILKGTCVAEVFTGHKVGESVLSVASCGHNAMLATGDSYGIIKTWNMSAFKGSAMHLKLAQSSIYNCHTWRGGARSIASLDWADGKHGAFIISGSTDCTVCLWRPDGTLVGSFGPHSWDSDLPYTWQQQERLPLEEKDVFALENSAAPPPARRLLEEEEELGSGVHSTAPLVVAKVCSITNMERAKAYKKIWLKKQQQDEAILRLRAATLPQAASSPVRGEAHSLAFAQAAAEHTAAKASSSRFQQMEAMLRALPESAHTSPMASPTSTRAPSPSYSNRPLSSLASYNREQSWPDPAAGHALGTASSAHRRVTLSLAGMPLVAPGQTPPSPLPPASSTSLQASPSSVPMAPLHTAGSGSHGSAHGGGHGGAHGGHNVLHSPRAPPGGFGLLAPTNRSSTRIAALAGYQASLDSAAPSGQTGQTGQTGASHRALFVTTPFASQPASVEPTPRLAPGAFEEPLACIQEDLLDSGSDHDSDGEVPECIWLPEFEQGRRRKLHLDMIPRIYKKDRGGEVMLTPAMEAAQLNALKLNNNTPKPAIKKGPELLLESAAALAGHPTIGPSRRPSRANLMSSASGGGADHE